MATDKRERQRQARQERIEREQHEAQAARRRRIGIAVGAAVAVVLLVVVAVNLLSDDDGDDAVDLATQADATIVEDDGATGTTAAPELDEDPSGTDVAVFANDECPPEDASGPQYRSFAQPPPMCIDPDTTYRATLATTAGDIVIDLDPALDEVSVNNFVVLARHHYYDGSTFHRVIEDFVVQGGDPVGDPPGTGGPGYSFTGSAPDTAGEDGTYYAIGDLAVANRGDPSSNGAQFFIVTGAQGAGLPNLYSLMGSVVEGLDVALEIQTVETDPATDRPVEDVVVETVTIEALA